jgi:hypothetical protein
VDLSMLSSNNVCLSYLCENLFVIYGPMNHCNACSIYHV